MHANIGTLVFGANVLLASLQGANTAPVEQRSIADLPSSVSISCRPGECTAADLEALRSAADLLEGGEASVDDWTITSNVHRDNNNEGTVTLARRDGENGELTDGQVQQIDKCSNGQCTEEELAALKGDLDAAQLPDSFWQEVKPLVDLKFDYGLDYKWGKKKKPQPTTTAAPAPSETTKAPATSAPAETATPEPTEEPKPKKPKKCIWFICW